MIEDPDFRSRLDRAQRMSTDHYVIDDDPFLIEVDSSSSDDDYTVVPNVAYCSCSDRQYRQYPCKHLLYLAVSDSVPSDVREDVVSGIAHRRGEMVDQISELSERLHKLQDRVAVWSAATHHFGPDDVDGIEFQFDSIEEWLDHLDSSRAQEPASSTPDAITSIAETVE